MTGVEQSAGECPDKTLLASALPDPVRQRLLSLVADVLPNTATLPPQLTRVAQFAPARRAKLGGAAILHALDGAEFRDSAAVQVAAVVGEAGERDAVSRAALAWLLRGQGWEQALAESLAEVAQTQAESEAAREQQGLARVQGRLDEAVESLRVAKAEHRAALEEVKGENVVLRRKLGEARVALKSALEEARGEVAEELAAEQAAAHTARTEAEAAAVELRRLRARIEELESVRQNAKREERSDRDEATLRARLLLDTLLDAGQGLRRELALPLTTGTPADRVESELLAGAQAATSSGMGALGPTSPAALEALLRLPKARLIIDGYNVSKSAWPNSSLEAQRVRLLGALSTLVAQYGAETTVVFDAATVTARPPVMPPRGVKVVFSPFGVIADDVIRQLVSVEPTGRVVVVVTGDREIIDSVRRDGARCVSAEALLGLLRT